MISPISSILFYNKVHFGVSHFLGISGGNHHPRFRTKMIEDQIRVLIRVLQEKQGRYGTFVTIVRRGKDLNNNEMEIVGIDEAILI